MGKLWVIMNKYWKFEHVGKIWEQNQQEWDDKQEQLGFIDLVIKNCTWTNKDLGFHCV